MEDKLWIFLAILEFSTREGLKDFLTLSSPILPHLAPSTAIRDHQHCIVKHIGLFGWMYCIWQENFPCITSCFSDLFSYSNKHNSFFFCLFETMISYQQVKWKHFTKLLPVFMFACLLKEKIWRIACYMRGETMAWKGQWWKVSRSRLRLTKNNTCSFINPQTHGAGCSWNTPWLMENCFLTLMNHSSGNTKYIQFLPNMKRFIICSVRFITVFPTSFMHAIKASTSSSAHFKHLHKAE